MVCVHNDTKQQKLFINQKFLNTQSLKFFRRILLKVFFGFEFLNMFSDFVSLWCVFTYSTKKFILSHHSTWCMPIFTSCFYPSLGSTNFSECHQTTVLHFHHLVKYFLTWFSLDFVAICKVRFNRLYGVRSFRLRFFPKWRFGFSKIALQQTAPASVESHRLRFKTLRFNTLRPIDSTPIECVPKDCASIVCASIVCVQIVCAPINCAPLDCD